MTFLRSIIGPRVALSLTPRHDRRAVIRRLGDQERQLRQLRVIDAQVATYRWQGHERRRSAR